MQKEENTYSMDTIIRTEKLNKIFDTGLQKVHVLKDVSIRIQEHTFSLLFGPSGCGKSTLLHAMMGLEQPSSGHVYFKNKDIYSMTEDERCDMRKSMFGIIQQQSHWVRALNVIENIALPLILWGYGEEMSLEKAKLVLDEVGMRQWERYSPVELSSGQQQKVALARALVNDAPVLVADEPTGNLDQEAGDDLIAMILTLVKQRGRTVLMVTHEERFKESADNIIQMIDGRIV